MTENTNVLDALRLALLDEVGTRPIPPDLVRLQVWPDPLTVAAVGPGGPEWLHRATAPALAEALVAFLDAGLARLPADARAQVAGLIGRGDGVLVAAVDPHWLTVDGVLVTAAGALWLWRTEGPPQG